MPTPDFRFGLPLFEQLQHYRIWDSYFTPAFSHPGMKNERLYADIERSQRAIEIGCIEKLCYFAHIGLGTTGDSDLEKKLRSDHEFVTEPLNRFPNVLLGMIQLNPHHVRGSIGAIDRWIVEGPMRGVYFPGGGPAAMKCTHENFLPIVEKLEETGAVIMQHTWFKTGAKSGTGGSTPHDLAQLAKEFPKQKFLCAHAGGEWEKGIRAVAETPNILIETSGFDATAGFVEMAVNALGSQRIVFGSHLPSRSLGTELSKVTAANISERDKELILGGNYRSLLSKQEE